MNQVNNNNSKLNNQIYPGNSKNPNYNPAIENIENLEDFPYRDEYVKEQDQKSQQLNPPEYDEAEFQKYYEEYLRKKMQEEMPNPNSERQNWPQDRNQIPTNLKEYESYKSQNQQNYQENFNRGYGVNVIIFYLIRI